MRECFSPLALPATGRFAKDAKFTEGKYIFFSAERAEKKKIYSLMKVKILSGHIKELK